MNRVRVEYFALLRERAGVNEETIETNAETPAQLVPDARVGPVLDIVIGSTLEVKSRQRR